MPFAYYERLSAARQRIYRRSDAIRRVELPDAAGLLPLGAALREALEGGDRAEVERACQALVDAIDARLATPPVRVRVLERRPADAAGELQGLYEPDEVTGGVARITVWMRTAQRVQVVRFRTFLRTLLHEVCHHLDYELYGFAETFHTEGFYARESSLTRAVLGEPPRASCDASIGCSCSFGLSLGDWEVRPNPNLSGTQPNEHPQECPTDAKASNRPGLRNR